jgi:hypothetical protein
MPVGFWAGSAGRNWTLTNPFSQKHPLLLP